MNRRLRFNMLSLDAKYRPTRFEEVVGQDHVVTSLRRLLQSSHAPHAFLFHGPSGCGKTTIARILAGELGCAPGHVAHVDAASYSGVADMRGLVKDVRHRAFGSSPLKAVILEEVHALSNAAWQVLLLPLENAPAHAYWIMCTTEVDKVPRTVMTRSHVYEVRSVELEQLVGILIGVAKREHLTIDPTIIRLCAVAASGSARQALANLSLVDGCSSRAEARVLLQARLG